MRSADQWLAEYAESHRHPVNKLLHWICVPAIVLAVAGLLWSVPVPASFVAASPWLNFGTIGGALAILWYLRLSPALAAGITLAFVLMFALVAGLASLPWPLWRSCTVIFVLAWTGQFIGHAVEGKRPSFFKDLQFLLVGPMWLVSFLYRRLHLAW